MITSLHCTSSRFEIYAPYTMPCLVPLSIAIYAEIVNWYENLASNNLTIVKYIASIGKSHGGPWP